MKKYLLGVFIVLILFSTINSLADQAFADVTIVPSPGSGSPGCEETIEGCYYPEIATVEIGEIIIFSNTDSAAHTFTSGTPENGLEGNFDTGLLMAGNSFQWIPENAGEYAYHCMVHPWMRGLIIVQGNATSISVWSDKTSYQEGDTINISGKVTNPISGTPVTYQIKSPVGNLVTIGSVSSIYDNFNFSLDSGGALWKSDGNYIIEIHHGKITVQTNFHYSNSKQSTTSPYVPTSITVTTDDDEYKTGDIIEISGSVTTLYSGTPVSVIIKAPNGNLVSIQQEAVQSDKTFFTEFDTKESASLMKTDGTYTVTVQYGTAKRSDQTTFEFEAIQPPYTPPHPSPTRDSIPPKILKPTDVTVDAVNANGVNVTYDVLAIDETDQIIQPSCNPSSGALFSVGTTKVTCNALDTAGNGAQSVSFLVTVNAPQLAIPNWIKNVAAFWCDDKIDDASFIEGIQYLIDNNIIVVSTIQTNNGETQGIPDWIKNNACWWSEGQISNEDFASGIEFLVSEGIIRV